MLAGLASGVTEAIIVNPFEVIKVKMQSNRSHQVSWTSLNQDLSCLKLHFRIRGQGSEDHCGPWNKNVDCLIQKVMITLKQKAFDNFVL